MEKDSPTLIHAILQRKNSLNFLRLILALMVIFGHAFPLVKNQYFELNQIAGFAVNMFFCISGFLITASAQRGNPLNYLWRRFLRIFPGYWVSMIIVAFIFAPLASLMGHSEKPWEFSLALGYMWQNFDLYNLQFDVGGGPSDIPYAQVWNGSIWTLWYECVAYLVIMPFVFLPLVRKFQRFTVTLAFFFSIGVYALVVLAEVNTAMYFHLARMIPMFLAGALLYVWGDKIKAISSLSIICIVVALLLQLFAPGWMIQLSQIIFAYGILGVASRLKIYTGYKHDLSYGVYIYAFPIQQLMMIFGTATLGILGNFILVSILSMGVAYLSWNLVEKPSLRLKNLFSRSY